MAWQGYPNGNEDNGEDNGWNAEDYMSDLDEIMGGTEGTTMEGLWEAMKSDYDKSQNQWLEQQKRFGDWFDRTQERTEKTEKLWEDFNLDREAAYEKQGELTEDWASLMEERSGKGVELAEEWGENLRGTFQAGSEYARDLQKKSTAKLEDLEGEMKDFSKASIAGLVRGTTAKERSNVERRQEEARRSGAPQSVIDNIAYEGSRTISEGLQGAIATSAMQWQGQLQEAGRAVASGYGQEAGLETDLLGKELGMEQGIMGAEMGALDQETSMLLGAAGKRVEFEGIIAANKDKYRHEQLIGQLMAEDYETNAMATYAKLMSENPAVQAAGVFATLLQYQSMPGYKELKEMQLPGMEAEKNASINRALLKKRGFSNVSFSGIGDIPPDEFAKAVAQYKGNYLGTPMSLEDFLERKFGNWKAKP